MAYATATTALTFLDARIVGDLVGDVGLRVSQTQLLTDPNFAAALSTAAGQINSAALVGERYTVLELQNLTGDDLNFLVMLNSWLAFGILCSRRGRDPKEAAEYVHATEMLDMLRDGKALFNVPADVAVGTPQMNFPSLQDYSMVNSLRQQTRWYFPTRPWRQVTPLGG